MKSLIFALALLMHAVAFSQVDSLRPPLHDPNILPQLKIKGTITSVDSLQQESLNVVYDLMTKYPTMVVSIVGLYEKEKCIAKVTQQAEVMRKRLIEMGIAGERLVIRVEKFIDQEDPLIQTRQAGNVIFEIDSYHYFPRKR